MFNDDIKLALKYLPKDADLTKAEWSWAFSSSEGIGVILHCDAEGTTTEYKLPLAVCQLVEAVRAHAVLELQCTIKNALGIPLVNKK